MSTKSYKYQIIIADDHEIVLIGLRSIITALPEYEVSAQAKTPSELSIRLSHSRCDILITDFSMPGDRYKDGLAMLELIRTQHPQLPIIVLTMQNNPLLLSAMLGVRVMGIMSKSGLTSELPKALMKVSLGQRYLSQDIHQRLVESNLARGTQLTILTLDEVEVLNQFVCKQTLDSIAHTLAWSRDTVITVLNSVMKKLNISSTAQLIDYLQAAGLTCSDNSS